MFDFICVGWAGMIISNKTDQDQLDRSMQI